MEDLDLGRLMVEIKGCRVYELESNSDGDIRVVLMGGKGRKYLQEVAALPFSNDHIELNVALQHEGYDKKTKETLSKWQLSYEPLNLAIREKISLLWDQTGLAVMLPPFIVDVDWTDGWNGSPIMN